MKTLNVLFQCETQELATFEALKPSSDINISHNICSLFDMKQQVHSEVVLHWWEECRNLFPVAQKI